MPLVVDLLLLDDDGRSAISDGSYHVSTGKGVYNELERQLQDATSHLRRKSAFGALITRGASIRFLRHEEFEDSVQSKLQSRAADPPIPHATASRSKSTDSSNSGLTPSRGSTSKDGGPPTIATVPRILDFPRSAASGPQVLSGSGLGMFRNLFNWLPSCAPVPCRVLPQQQMDSCSTIFISDPELMGRCVPAPTTDDCPDGSSTGHEAGLGGWPLCLPLASAAFPGFPQIPDASNSLMHGGKVMGVGSTSKEAAHSRFQKAAVEMDDNELAIILVPPRRSSSSQHTSPRIPTAACDDISPPSDIAGGASCRRLIFPLENIASARQWHKMEVANCWHQDERGDPECVPPWNHIIEISGTTHCAANILTVLVSLPSPTIATRLHDALARVRRATKRQARTDGARCAVRCELHISANLDLARDEGRINCAAVVRRGICEACHIGADRVVVSQIREGDSGPVAPQPVAPPASDAAPPPAEIPTEIVELAPYTIEITDLKTHNDEACEDPAMSCME